MMWPSNAIITIGVAAFCTFVLLEAATRHDRKKQP